MMLTLLKFLNQVAQLGVWIEDGLEFLHLFLAVLLTFSNFSLGAFSKLNGLLDDQGSECQFKNALFLRLALFML